MEHHIGRDDLIYRCFLVPIKNLALELSPGLMWWCISFPSVGSDGVNRSICTELLCSRVYYLDSVKDNYPYPVACKKRSPNICGRGGGEDVPMCGGRCLPSAPGTSGRPREPYTCGNL